MEPRGQVVLQDHNFSPAGPSIKINDYKELDFGEGQPGSPHQAKDYHLSYHFASEGGDLTTTTAAPVISVLLSIHTFLASFLNITTASSIRVMTRKSFPIFVFQLLSFLLGWWVSGELGGDGND